MFYASMQANAGNLSLTINTSLSSDWFPTSVLLFPLLSGFLVFFSLWFHIPLYDFILHFSNEIGFFSSIREKWTKKRCIFSIHKQIAVWLSILASYFRHCSKLCDVRVWLLTMKLTIYDLSDSNKVIHIHLCMLPIHLLCRVETW